MADIRFQLRGKFGDAITFEERRREFLQALSCSTQQLGRLTDEFENTLAAHTNYLRTAFEAWKLPVTNLIARVAADLSEMEAGALEFNCCDALALPEEAADDLEHKMHRIKSMVNAL